MKHLYLALGLAVLAAGCVDHRAPITGVQSFQVDLLDPADPGSDMNRLPAGASTVTIQVSAIGPDNQVDPTFTRQLDVYVAYLGTLTPPHEKHVPLTHVQVTNGMSAATTVDVPLVYGPTQIWVEDVVGTDATYAAGASPTIWFRDPFIADVQTPPDESALDALQSSPLEGKQVTVNSSRYGANGRLVVNGVYAQGYTLDDVQCADANGTPPCVAGDYDHIYVFSFSRPKDQNGQGLEVGETVSAFAGGISEFNGLTEVGFPQSFVDDPTADPSRVAAPVVADQSWFQNKIMFERNEAGLIEIDNATVCPTDSDYTTYKQR